MKIPAIKIYFTTLLIICVLVACKKKEDKTPVPATDYRDQYCGSYSVTFSVSADAHGNGQPYTVEKVVVIRLPEADETSGDPDKGSWITLTNLPSPGERTIPLKQDGTADFGAMLNLQDGKFYSQWTDGGGSQSKLVLGQGTKLP